jgi:hypothetical protein
MGKHNVKTHDGAKRSRARRESRDMDNDFGTSRTLRKAAVKLDKRQSAWDTLSLDKKQKTTRPGSMKTRTN